MVFPIFAYQSLNANSSKNHNIASLNSQQHTVMAHDHFAAAKSEARVLSYPTNPDYPGTPIYGPAQALSPGAQGAMDKGNHSDQEFSLMLGNKVLQVRQAICHNLGSVPDLVTFGEVDHTHTDLASFNALAGSPVALPGTQNKACQNFSIYRGSVLPATFLGSAEGWSAVEIARLVVVFVHVPNAKAKDRAATVQFYKGIQSKLGGRVFDIVMGDTNQGTAAFTPECVTAAVGTTGIQFLDAHPGKDIAPIDGYKLTMNGTNSKLDRKYDVAVYNRKTVRILECGYFTQHVGGGAGMSKAVTDHMGIVIKVENLKTWMDA